MANPRAAAGGEHSIQMPTPSADGSGDEPQRRAPEVALNEFVRNVALVEWAGNAFGVLAFTWATVVLLGGFCSSLNRDDFWFATVMIFIEAFRIFSRSYKLDNHSLFGTTRALRWWMKSSFARMLGRQQEGDEVVLIMSLWLDFISMLVLLTVDLLAMLKVTLLQGRDMQVQFYMDTVEGILKVASLVVMSKMQLRRFLLESAWRRSRQLLLWVLLIGYLFSTAFSLSRDTYILIEKSDDGGGPILLPEVLADIASMAVAVLLLNLRPRCLANRTSSPCARKLVSLAKLVSALCLAAYLVLADTIYTHPSSDAGFAYLDSFNTPIARVVLSLGSLQKRSPATSPAGRGIDVIMHVLFLLHLVVPITPFLYHYWAHLSTPSIAAISSIILSAALLVGNLQIPLAVVQVVLSSWQLYQLLVHKDYYPRLVEGSAINLVPAIAVFYLLALCQGALYTMACVIGLFSFIPRRSLVRRSNFTGHRGARAIDLYYQEAYATLMKIGVLSSRNRISLSSFAMDSLCSGSREMELAGLIVLDRLLQEGQPSEELVPRITSSYKEVSTLISMLGWTAKQDRDIRLFAARVTAKLAGSVRIARFPGMINMVSSLLDAEIQSADQQGAVHGGGSNGGGCSSWVPQCWQRMKENWSLPKDPPSSHQDLLPVLGMVILEKLAHDQDNCAEIFKATNLISKAERLMSYSTNDGSSEEEQQIAVIGSSLNFVRRLAITGEKIGAMLRQELQNNLLLLNNLAAILEDTRSNPKLWKPAIDIIAMLALDKRAGKQIGRMKVITGKLMHAFLARCGPASINDDRSLPMAAGEALANLAMWGTANCSAILEEPGYEIIKDLKSMLSSEDEYRYVAANLLQDLCAHCRVKLMNLPDASEHLSSVLTTVMEHIEAAEGKQLESLIGLACEIADIIQDAFVRKLESQTNNGAELVQKLVATLNSANRKPNPEYPRMRRFIVKIVIAIFESCHGTVEKMREERLIEGFMEALTKIERTTSKVEKYRVFYGNIGVVLESGEPMPALVASAKALIRPATQPAEGRR